MKLTCENIREKLAEFINDRIDPKEDNALTEHLNQCPDCNKYYHELKADDQELSDFADSLQPILDRIETNINKELETGKIRTIPIQRNIFLRIAVAAMILIGAFVTLNQFGIILYGTSAAWAKVSQIVIETQTITFNVVIGIGPSVFCTASEKKLKQKLSSGIEAIFDYDKSKILVLNPNDKTAMNIELSGLPIMPSNLFLNFKSTIELLKECPDTIVKRLGKRDINNKETAGIHVYLDESIDIKIWYDAKDNIPVLVIAETMIGQTNIVFSDFNFDVIVDESEFNLDIPENYTEIESVKMDLKNLTEQDLIEGLRAWASLMENRFPEKLDLAIIREYSKVIEQTLNEKGMSDIEKSLIVMKIMRALMFIDQLTVQWYSFGDNVKLGDSNTPIFWYQPWMSKTYRVLYGDLHFADVYPENLPKRP
ncbi:MAG: zf-HC2 domain-containing protein [Planctomycetes bacterium]|nr:zf-HC2 domain-containing protein [Planctomycetota bacterium]MBL7146163.1 zf-HC2 domain-containing protein [Phycisphaerae bacterium]